MRQLRIGKEKKKKPQDENIMSSSATQGGHNQPTLIIKYFTAADAMKDAVHCALVFNSIFN